MLESEVLPILRNIIDDTDASSYEYSDDRLISLIYIAATYVNSELNFEYDISVCNQIITQTPSSKFINLVSYKAACILMRSIQKSYAQNDFRVTDGPATVDIKGVSDKIENVGNSICAEYDKLKFNNIMNDGGYSISTPNSES